MGHIEGHLYALPTDDLEKDGDAVYAAVEESGYSVLGGGGVRGDIRSSQARVEIIVDRPLSAEDRARFRKLGFPLLDDIEAIL